mgnify:CR=1 FL=1
MFPRVRDEFCGPLPGDAHPGSKAFLLRGAPDAPQVLSTSLSVFIEVDSSRAGRLRQAPRPSVPKDVPPPRSTAVVDCGPWLRYVSGWLRSTTRLRVVRLSQVRVHAVFITLVPLDVPPPCRGEGDFHKERHILRRNSGWNGRSGDGPESRR